MPPSKRAHLLKGPLPSCSLPLYNERIVLMHPTALLRPLLLAFLLLSSAQSLAEESEDRHAYQGAYWGLQAHTGLIIPETHAEGSTPGLSYGVSTRLALFASLLDLQLKASAGHYTLATPEGALTPVDRLSIGVENHAHPFLVLIIQKRPMQQWLAGLYLSLGLDLDLTHRRDTSEWFVNPALKMGLGSEYPLSEPDKGWSLWLGVNYHYKLSFGVAPELGDLNEHMIEFTFGYRNNDIFFMRAPRFDEFDYKNKPLDDR